MFFGKAFHLILMHFIHYIQCFEDCFQKLGYFFKMMFFQIFDWSNLFFGQSNFLLKYFVSFCLFQSIETVFRSIETRELGFLKIRFDLFKTPFQKQGVKPNFPKVKISYILHKFSSIKSVLHKTQSICKLGWSDQRHTQ